jgi:hypothetical protein
MRKMMLTLLAIAALATVAAADVLWDQSATAAPGSPGYFNADSGSPPFGMTVFTVTDIVVDDVWNVDAISTFWSILDEANWTAITEGYLHVIPKTGDLPAETDDPTASQIVSMSATVSMNEGTLTASGLNLDLYPGEYWIGITPIMGSGFMGPEIQYAADSYIGVASASFDPNGWPMPMWMNMNTDTDATLLIEGIVTVATESHSLSAVKTLFR